jgi:hypothetical protein
VAQSEQEPESEILIARDEWERFLSSVERLMALHQSAIQRLKELSSRNQTLRQELSAIQHSGAAKPERGEGRRLAESNRAQQVQRKYGFINLHLLNHLKAKLESLENAARRSMTSNFPRGYASCTNCRYQIKRASRFCERCGANFGKLTCPCGRELSSTDKFCDVCGRSALT